MEENPKLYTISTNTADMFISNHISIYPPKGCLLKLERTSHKAPIVLIMKQRTLGVWSEGGLGELSFVVNPYLDSKPTSKWSLKLGFRDMWPKHLDMSQVVFMAGIWQFLAMIPVVAICDNQSEADNYHGHMWGECRACRGTCPLSCVVDATPWSGCPALSNNSHKH